MMLEGGFSTNNPQEEKSLKRVDDLLLKRTLRTPPLPDYSELAAANPISDPAKGMIES